MKKRVTYMLLAFLLVFNTISPTLVHAHSVLGNSVQTTIKAKVSIRGEKLEGRIFRFGLYKEGDDTAPISSAYSDEDGMITFDPVSFDSPGEYRFKIVQYKMQNQNMAYDEEEKIVTVKLTEEDFKTIEDNKTYYGTAPQGEHITMGETIGAKDFQVFCIDNHKTLPPETATDKQYVAITDPDNYRLEKMVTKNLWGEELSTVLKKIFFYFQAYPDVYNINQQHNIVWAATGAYGDNQDSLAQYAGDINEILKVLLPQEYHLVVFHPVIDVIKGDPNNADSQDVYYQDLAMGYGAAIENNTKPNDLVVDIPEFINSVKEDPIDPDPGKDADNKFYINISKVKEDDSYLSDANLSIIRIDKPDNSQNIKWISSDKNKVIQLEAGEYELVEEKAPNGYEIAKKITFKINDQGQVQIKSGDSYNEISDNISYESYTKKSEYGEEYDGHYSDNIYIKPIGGESEHETVGYCFNANRRPPEESPDNLKEGKYEKLEEKDFKSLADNSKISSNEQLVKLVKEAVWEGYPNNKTGIQGNISNERFRALTQAAIWLYTDDKQLDDIPYFIDNYTQEEKEVYRKLIESDTAQVPDNFKLNIYKSTNNNYQNVLSTSYTNGESLIPSIKMVDKKSLKPQPTGVELLIKKVAKSTGVQLKGATLGIFKGEGISGEKVKDIQTNGMAEKLNLEEGIYTISELVAPEGYKKASDINFKIENGKLYIKQGKGYVESENYEEVDSNNYEAFSDFLDDSSHWSFTPYGKHYYLKENGGKGQVLYCFNIDLHAPVDSYDDGQTIEYNPIDGGEVRYTKIINPKELVAYSENPRIKDPQKFYESIRRVIYAGYPNKNAGIGKNLSNTTYKAVTQLAMYYFTDSIDYKTVKHGFQEIREDENKEILQAYLDLVSYAENEQTEIPEDFKLSIYKSNNSRYQNLIGTQYNPNDLLYTITMVDEKQPQLAEKEVTFSKTEVNGTKELEGANLKVVEGEGKGGKLVEEWTSGKEQKKMTLTEGIYTMIETQAPDGYEVAEEITFRVTHEGKVEVKQKDGQYKALENSTVKMEDALKQLPIVPATTKVKVQKAWSNTAEEAKKEVTVELYKNGQKTGETIKLNEDNNWTGEFTGLKVVDQVDQKTPNNYTVKEVGEDGGVIGIGKNNFAVTIKGTAKEGYTVTNTYKPTEKEVTFSKTEVNGTKELEGANLKVVEGEGKGGKLVEEWTSGKEQKKMTLTEGIYTMIETQAPDGYEVAEEITFRVTHEGKVEVKQKDGQYKALENSTVKMEDALKQLPIVPNKPGKGKTNISNDINKTSPKTSDESNMSFYIGLMFISGAILITLGIRFKKGNDKI